MEKLRECPLCGGEAKFGINKSCCGKTVRIDCTNPQCGANINAYSSKAEAAKVWNRRPVPENKPLTLDEMRQMNGEPVYISFYDDDIEAWDGFWRLCWGFETRLNDGKCVLNTHMGPDFTITDYGKTWITYRHAVEMGGKK